MIPGLVIDTNAVAYLLLKTEPHHLALQKLLAEPHSLHAPASWEVEFANVLWLSSRAGVIPPGLVEWKLRLAASLGIESTPVSDLWHTGIEIALSEDHPVYDTLFVALARRMGAPLITYDKAVLRKFPDVARRAQDLNRP